MTRSADYNTGFTLSEMTCKLGALCFYSSSVQIDSLELRTPPMLIAAAVIAHGKKTKYSNEFAVLKGIWNIYILSK